jgi:hypothetical protein
MARKPRQPSDAPEATAAITSEVVIAPAPIPNPPHGPGAENVTSPYGSSLSLPSGMDRPLTTRLSADPRQEYVSRQGLTTAAFFVETLSPSIDDIEAEFGADLYERMVTDPQVAGEVNALILSALSGQVLLTAALEPPPGEEPTPERKAAYDRAEAVRAFCQFNLDHLATPLLPWLFDMARAVYLGHRVSEVVYRDGTYTDAATDETLPDALLLDRLKIKPCYSFAFVVDTRMNLVGLVVNLAGRVTTLLTPVVFDPTNAPNLMPPDKFAVYSFRPKEGDPRGTSLLRAAYNAWWLKRRTLEERHKFLVNVAGGPLFGTTAEGAQDAEDGTTPEEAMANTLATVRNGTSVAFPAGSTVAPVYPATNDGAAFAKALADLNIEISKAITSQSLATNEGEHNARAAADNAKNVLDLIAEEIEQDLAGVLKGVLKVLVEVNYPPQDWEYVPNVSLSQAEEADLAPAAAAFSQAMQAGIIQKAQLPYVWSKLGLPVISLDEMDPEPAPMPMPGETGDNGDTGPKKAGFSWSVKKKYASIRSR